ncbi:MAG: bifunctional YncE family protein/alkaline phosphatase family protein [Saprospiraceae bacterium]|nr:bifunctional YncE family protein/alkaline phosphatase family protein [Saprospiraceae bacterium]
MLNISRLVFLILMIVISSCDPKQKREDQDVWIISAPAGVEKTHINRTGKTILPNGRYISPAGICIETAPHPYGMTLSKDDNVAVTANSGINPLSITIIRNILSAHPEVQQVPPGASTDDGVLASVFMGLAISPDNQVIYVAGGQENKVYLFDVNTGADKGQIDCSERTSDRDYCHGYIGDMKLSNDGKTLYAVDQIGFRMVVLDTEIKKLIHSVPVGRYPFGICLSPDEKKAYVANVGMFEYSYIKESQDVDSKIKPIDYPAFGYGSEEMISGINNDTMMVNGLGDQNAIEAFSVFAISLKDKDHPRVASKIKTGHLVGSLIEGIPAVGGSSPNSIVATDDYVFVSNGNNDNISVISAKYDSVIHTIDLKPDDRLKHFRGVIPFGLAISPDQKQLFVAESGINAIGVISLDDFKVRGHIPAAWFPAKVEVSKDGKKLFIANAKGYGSGPNGGASFYDASGDNYIGSLMKGSVQIVDIPDGKLLEEMTKQVIDNNFTFTKAKDPIFKWRKNNPIPLYPGEKVSPIKHIVFISKENRTYDEVFGQIEKGDGDSTLARYGKNVAFSNRKKTKYVADATVMPNHLGLVKEFAISDNFYVDSDVSADGHRWLVNTYPNEWCETTTAASYGNNRDFIKDSKAPGVFAMNGAAGAIYPEDYNEAGSMWDHLERHKVDFYNFGFSVMFEPALYAPDNKYTGVQHYINYPVPQPLFGRTSRSYPTYNMAIPDQFRIDQFIKEFDSKWVGGKDTMPAFMTVIIPNDHGAGDRPEAGYPYRESYMADNDMAVGRIVEYLSHTEYWENMLIVVTEDDAQNGIDHIDAHRSILMLVSPWIKRDYVSHIHYSFGSIFKTFWNILGLPYLNQYDAGATDMSDFFADIPNLTTYDAVAVERRIFDPQKALDPLDEKFNWKAIRNSPQMDNIKDMFRESKEKDAFRLENRERK